jgi:hypothetical protein
MFKEWNDCLQGNVATLSCIPTIFLNLLSALLAFTGLTALLMFVLGGFKLMNAAEDPKKITAASNNFKFGIIGGLIVLFSFLIINVISTVTGVECIRKFGFDCQ